MTTLDETLRALWEPGASTVEERFHVIDEARRAGLRTAIMFGPLLPFLSDSQGSIDALLERAGDLGIDVIWVDALNRRPRVWPAVARSCASGSPSCTNATSDFSSTRTLAPSISKSSASASPGPRSDCR